MENYMKQNNSRAANIIDVVFNGTPVEVFYKGGHSYREVFPLLEKHLGRLHSLSRGIKRKKALWPYEPAPYYSGDTHRVCFRGVCLYYNRGKMTSGPTFGDLRLSEAIGK